MLLDEQEQLWLATMKMGMAVKKKSGIELSRAFDQLRSAKTLLNECRLDDDAEPEILASAQEMINTAHREIYIAGEALGTSFTKKWDETFDKIMRGEKIGEFPISKPTFEPGMPKGKWIKIKPPKGLKVKKLREIAKAKGLKIEKKDEHYILIGDSNSLQEALKSIKETLKQTVKK